MPKGTSLVELLDERHHLLAVAVTRLGSASLAEEALERAYGQWFGLAPQEREHLSPPRPWLTRLVDRTCAEIVRSTPIASDAGLVEAAPVRAPLPTRPDDLPAEPPGRYADIVNAFSLACRTDNRLALDAVLAPPVTALVDGGGRLRIDPSPVRGSDEVSHFLRSLLGGQPELVMTEQSVNGTTGLVVRYRRAGAQRPGDEHRRAGAQRPGNEHRRAGAQRPGNEHRRAGVVAVVSLEIIGNRVHQVCVVVNPDKLRSWNRG